MGIAANGFSILACWVKDHLIETCSFDVISGLEGGCFLFPFMQGKKKNQYKLVFASLLVIIQDFILLPVYVKKNGWIRIVSSTMMSEI